MSLGKMQRYLPEEKQGLVYYMCRNYKILPDDTQKQIKSLCDKICKMDAAYSNALLEYLVTDDYKRVSMNYYISETTLSRLRGRFFKNIADNGGQLGFIIKSG